MTQATNQATNQAITLTGITTLCKSYADARDQLSSVSEEIRAMQRTAVRSRLRGLKSRVAEVSAVKEELQLAIESNPHLFTSPRTRAIDGIKVGYRKMPGKIECDEARTMERIRKQCPEQAADLIRTKHSLVRPALKNLDSKTMARIGITLVEVDDEVVIAAASSDLDKLVDALLADGEDEA